LLEARARRKEERKMEPRDLAKKYLIRINVIYKIIYDLETVQGFEFTKRNGKYQLGPTSIDLIESVLRDRGYTSCVAT